MSTELTASEVLEIAELIEREAAAFYRGAAAAASGDERRQLLELAEMEDEHVQVFHGLRIRAAQEAPAAPDPAARRGMPFTTIVALQHGWPPGSAPGGGMSHSASSKPPSCQHSLRPCGQPPTSSGPHGRGSGVARPIASGRNSRGRDRGSSGRIPWGRSMMLKCRGNWRMWRPGRKLWGSLPSLNRQ